MTRDVSIEVKGIHCEGCENTIQTALSGMPGVVAVKASHKAQRVDVRMHGDGVAEAVKERLRNLGYEVAV